MTKAGGEGVARSGRALGQCGLRLLLQEKWGAIGGSGAERDMTCINSLKSIALAAEWKGD